MYHRNTFCMLSAILILACSAAHAQIYPRIETGRHTESIHHIAVDAAGRWLVTASDDKTARVWNLRTNQLERVLRPPIGEADVGRLQAVAISPDGSHIVVGGMTGRSGQPQPIYLFERVSGRLVGRSRGFGSSANALAYSPDGRRIAAVFGANVGLRILDAAHLTRVLSADDDCGFSGSGVDFDRSGRLVTSCNDGFLRLYSARGRRVARRPAGAGVHPASVRFSPDGTRIAVGFSDSRALSVVSGADLTPLYQPDTSFSTAKLPLVAGSLPVVAWSPDGQRLYAAGTSVGVNVGRIGIIAMWSDQGRSGPDFPDEMMDAPVDMVQLPDGRLIFATRYPAWGISRAGGHKKQLVVADVPRPTPEDGWFVWTRFVLSSNGMHVMFDTDYLTVDGEEGERANFDLDSHAPSDARARLPFPYAKGTPLVTDEGVSLLPPRTEGLPVTGWRLNKAPRLDGRPITTMERDELSSALSVAADHGSFVLGTDSHLRRFDAGGRQLWARATPGIVWYVHQSDDGRFVIAYLGDRTIRWYEGATGRELLALCMVHDKRWVLFTPEGFYQASPGGDALLGYQINQGADHEGQFVDAAQLADVFFRPDLITRRLAGDETAIAAALRVHGDVSRVLSRGLPPAVTLLSSPVADVDGRYELKVRITPARAGGRVGALQLTVNGAEIQGHTPVPPGGGVVTEPLLLPSGKNRVSVRALRADGEVASSPVEVEVNVHPAASLPVLHLLAVGISQYDDPRLDVGVTSAARDAIDFASQLGRGADGMYSALDAEVLTTRAETGLSRVEAGIKGLISRVRPQDVVVIYLAGHGTAIQGSYHFIPADFIDDGEDAFSRGGTLSQERLQQMLRDLGAARCLLILDTSDFGPETPGRGAAGQRDAAARLMRSSGRYVLAAAQEGEAAGVQGHSLYTHALLEGLAGRADPRHTGVIELAALASYAAHRVPELGGSGPIPLLSASSAGSFPLVRDVPPQSSTAAATAGTQTPAMGDNRDCPDCPEMVAIRPGSFEMGSPPSERERRSDEGPVHRVTIAYGFSVAKHPITRKEYRTFVKATGRVSTGCGGNGHDWEIPGFAQGDSHPVVCATWRDAQDYAAWLSRRTGKHYRLLTEAEYEYVERAGSTTAYFWGERLDCKHVHVYEGGDDCEHVDDANEFTLPVEHFPANAFGLYDMAGNVEEWTQDCDHTSYDGAPSDGRAWTTGGECSARVLRGGIGLIYTPWLRSAARHRLDSGLDTAWWVGFRVARTP